MRIIYLIIFCSVIFSQHGVDPSWIEAVPLPKNNIVGSAKGVVGNNMVITSEEKIIIFYQEEYPFPNGQMKTYITTSVNNGNDWTTPDLFSPFELVSGGCCTNVSLDSQDNIHIIWKGASLYGIYYSKMDNNLNLIIDTIRVSENINYNVGSATISVDGNDRIHSMWHDGDATSEIEIAEVMYSRSIDGGFNWENSQMISQNDNISSSFARVDFSGAFSDTLAIAWRDQINSNDVDVRMALSIDGGISWNEKPISVGPGKQWDPGIIIDKDNYFHINYHEVPSNNPYVANIMAGWSNDGGDHWEPNGFIQISPENIRSNLTAFAYDLFHDYIWVFWKDHRDGHFESDVMGSFSTDKGESWSQPEFVSDLGDQQLGFKSTTCSPNGIIAVNFDEWNSETGSGTIYYTQRTNIDILIGDVNSDGFVNVIDIVSIVNLILSNEFNEIGDLNDDSNLDVIDIVYW
ncbi:MAG: hypothetical protein H8E60_10160 [Candidatus Marinimicrobia bacterium]|nr:hypothetical protein [Candidatus Neomarinimicrobiota bacterium]